MHFYIERNFRKWFLQNMVHGSFASFLKKSVQSNNNCYFILEKAPKLNIIKILISQKNLYGSPRNVYNSYNSVSYITVLTFQYFKDALNISFFRKTVFLHLGILKSLNKIQKIFLSTKKYLCFKMASKLLIPYIKIIFFCQKNIFYVFVSFFCPEGEKTHKS